MFAAHYKLDNFCAIFDCNGLQIDGPVTEVMNPYPHDAKLEAFGFHVISIDGNDFDAIEWGTIENGMQERKVYDQLKRAQGQEEEATA